MTERQVLGFVGVGLMGWGMAKNAVEKGWPLRVVAHRKREAVEDLVARGAVELGSLAEMAAECDVIALCVTGAPEVQAAVAAMLPTARPGLTLIDCSTSEPDVTARLAAELEGRGITLFDAPLSRTPAHAWTGELTTYCGGPLELIEAWRPLLATWANVIIPTGGPVGSAHAVKLVNNLVALGYASIWAECYGMVRRIGADPAVFREVVTNSGMNCPNFQNFSKFAVEGDPEGHRFTLENALKDLTYYRRMAEREGTVRLMSDGALETLSRAVEMGMGPRYIPELTEAVIRMNDADPG